MRTYVHVTVYTCTWHSSMQINKYCTYIIQYVHMYIQHEDMYSVHRRENGTVQGYIHTYSMSQYNVNVSFLENAGSMERSFLLYGKDNRLHNSPENDS